MPPVDGELIASGGSTALVPAGLPSARLDFTDGADGTRMAWAKRQVANPSTALGYGYGVASSNGFLAAARNPMNRESAVVAGVAVSLLTSNPHLAILAENLATQAIGDGLTLSSKIDPEALGITPAEARKLSSDIERGFKAWAGNPRECDLRGTHTLHQIAHSSFTSYLLTGESVAVMDWARYPGVSTATKVALLGSEQLDRMKSGAIDGGRSDFMGVHFDRRGRVLGYWLREYTAGQQIQKPMPRLVSAYNSWGRPVVLHLFDYKLPGQVRGMSPMVAAMTPAHEKNTLQEYALFAAMLGTSLAVTVESDLGPEASMAKLSREGMPGSLGEFAAEREGWYGNGNKIAFGPGQVNHLAPGDKMKFNRSEAPNNTYAEFDKSLSRTAAKAAGSSYEDMSGDYSSTSFSASRMATWLPNRINLRRRKAIPERLYAAALECWLEEAIATGQVQVPDSAVPFWKARGAYCAGQFLGPPMVQPDPKKAAEADILEIENNLATLTQKLAERGIDFEEMIAQRKYEREALEAAGMSKNEVGTLTTQNKRTETLPADERDED